MKHKFKSHFLLAAIAMGIIGLMSFRTRSYESDLSLISWMLVVVATAAAYASWLKARMLTICIGSWIVGSAVTWIRPSFVACVTCLWEIQGEKRDEGATFFINNTEHFFLVAAVLSVVSILFGGLVGSLVSRYRKWIELNFVSFAILSVVVFATGSLGYEYGQDIMPHVSRKLACLIGATTGLIFCGAWIGTNRPFVAPPTDAKDET